MTRALTKGQKLPSSKNHYIYLTTNKDKAEKLGEVLQAQFSTNNFAHQETERKVPQLLQQMENENQKRKKMNKAKKRMTTKKKKMKKENNHN